MRNIILAALTTLISSSALAEPCKVPGHPDQSLWEVPLTFDELYKSHPPGNTLSDVEQWTFKQQSYLFSQLFQASQDDACNLWALKASPSSGTFTLQNRQLNKAFPVPNDPTQFECAFDCNKDGQITAADKSACGVAFISRVTEEVVRDTDPVCDRDTDVQGPYKDGTTGATDLNSSFVRGAPFTDDQPTFQKTRFKTANMLRQPDVGMLKSDAYEVPMYDPDLMVWFFHTDIDQFLDTTPGSPDSVQVDHIVPRMDRFGCGCGTNSPRNAALVSQQLNGYMSNDPGSPMRIAMLCAYAKWPGCPGTPYPMLVPGGPVTNPLAPTAHLDVTGGGSADASDAPNDATTPNEIGGCAVGGAGGAATLALIGLATFARRRKRS